MVCSFRRSFNRPPSLHFPAVIIRLYKLKKITIFSFGINKLRGSIIKLLSYRNKPGFTLKVVTTLAFWARLVRNVTQKYINGSKKNIDILAVYFENLTILKIPSLLSSMQEMVDSSYKMIFNIDRIWKIKRYTKPWMCIMNANYCISLGKVDKTCT